MKRYNLITLVSLLFPFLQPTAQKSVPKLMVGIVVDQMCYEYLTRFEAKFGKDGFVRLQSNGSTCEDARYTYVPTFTGPGHATIYTGTEPTNHGIIANDWYVRSTNSITNCVDDHNVNTVGSNSKEGACSPNLLKTTTITDQLKLTYPNAKVISLSIKDRGAILPGGHLSDGSYWYDYSTGCMISSTYFCNELPEWVKSFNSSHIPNNLLQQDWNTYYPIETYWESLEDNNPYEQSIAANGQPVFPYEFKNNTFAQNNQLFTSTPFANTYLTDMAITALTAENLGTDKQTDFLCISYSTPDIVGHAYGPYSIELEDIYIRLDKDIARLLKQLDENVGKNKYTLFLTADHAVVPVPQLLADKKLPGGYIYFDGLINSLKENLEKTFGIQPIAAFENLNIYLNDSLFLKHSEKRKLVENYIVDETSKWDHIKAVYNQDDFRFGNPSDPWLQMVKKGIYNGASGDIVLLLEPGFLPKHTDTPTSHKGTSHGSAYNYDTHVPLIWYGKDIPKQKIYRTVSITDISATITSLLKLQRTGAMTGNCILEIMDH